MVVFYQTLLSSNISSNCLFYFSDTDVTVFFYVFFRVVNFVVGLPANLCTIGIICSGAPEALVAEIQHLNLAVCEALYCLSLPVEIYGLITCKSGQWSLSPQFPALMQLQVGLVWIGRPIFQSSICVERYIAVVHPLTFIRVKQLKYKVTGSVVAWFFFFQILLMGVFIPNSDKIDGLVWVFLTLGLFCYCCCAVLFSLKRDPPGEREWDETTSGARMKKRAFNIILVHLLCFMVNYGPPVVLNFFSYNTVTLNLFHFFGSLGNICGLIHPLHYLHRAGRLSWLLAALTGK